jgi:hypothetical protein
LHIVAGIAAMGVAAVLGMIVHLNNTAIFTSSCVAYVAVSMWAEGRISKHRSQLQGQPQIPDAAAPDRGGDQRSVDQRGGDPRSAGQHGIDHRSFDQPAVDESAADQPAAEQMGEQRPPDHRAGQRHTRREGNAA